MADSEVLKIVWGETWRLAPKDGSPQTIARLQAVVAKMAVQAKGRGLAYQLAHGLAPRSDQSEAVSRWAAMSAIADDVAANRWRSGAALPERAVLWEINDDGRPRGDRPPPQAAAWILNPACPVGGDFLCQDGAQTRTFRLFESSDTPGGAELPFLSSLTGSGVPQPSVDVKAQTSNTRWAWGVGLVAVAMFFAAGVATYYAGRNDGLARLKIQDVKSQYEVVDALASACLSDAQQFPKLRRSVCNFLLNGDVYQRPTAKTADGRWDYGDKLALPLATIKRCFNVGLLPAEPADGAKPTDEQLQDRAASCELVSRAAAEAAIFSSGSAQGVNEQVGDILGLSSVATTRSVLLGLLGQTLGIAGLAAALGKGMKGKWSGICIDERSRFSLARAQVTLWTIIALGGFATIAQFNVGLGAATTFPQIPAAIAAALGIAFASPMVSALILDRQQLSSPDSPLKLLTNVGNKAIDDKDFSDRGLPAAADDKANPLECRATAADARATDFFVGEHLADKDQIDISRLQNVVITATLALGYFYSLLSGLIAIPTTSLLTGIPHLPDPGAAFTSVLLVSHATYLGAKGYAGSAAPPRSPAAPVP